MRCVQCWPDLSVSVQDAGPFRLVRDPGHWGANEPDTLVLGISKGNTQAKAFQRGAFDEVAFKGIRHRLLSALQSVGLLPDEILAHFERRFSAVEKDFAFASVVRCSLTGMDPRKRTHTADSPNVIPAFKNGSPGNRFADNCIDRHLVALSARTKRVVLLGNSNDYIRFLSEALSRRRGAIETINPVAYISAGVRFVHITHPSKGNGHFNAFIEGIGTSGRKRDWARSALGVRDESGRLDERVQQI